MDDARLFLCVRCQCQVRVCSRCDRGQQYCGTHCSGLARGESLRAAGRAVSANSTRSALSCRAPAPLPTPVPRRRARGNSDASRFRIAPMRCCTRPSSSCDARGEPADVQTGHHDALPLLCTPDRRVCASSLAPPAGTTTYSRPHLALTGAHRGDQRRTQGADPALPLRRALAGGDHRLPARHSSLHRRAGAGRGRGGARAPASATPLEARPLHGVHRRDVGALPHPDRCTAVRHGQGAGLHRRARSLPPPHRAAASPSPA